jgi:hypothetical protein
MDITVLCVIFYRLLFVVGHIVNIIVLLYHMMAITLRLGHIVDITIWCMSYCGYYLRCRSCC